MSKINIIKTTIGVATLILVIIVTINGVMEDSKKYEKQACEMVSELLKDNGSETTCKEVVFKEHPTDSYWKGEAFLSNVNSIKIGFMKNGDSVYVKLLDANLLDLE